MKDGFLRVAALTAPVRVADPDYNCKQMQTALRAASAQGARLIAFQELSVTAYTCGDLFLQSTLLQGATDALAQLIRESADVDALCFVGLPWQHQGKLLNVFAAFQRGRLLALIPKTHIPNYGEFSEARWFSPGPRVPVEIRYWDGVNAPYLVPLGTDILLRCADLPDLVVAVEICEDLWTPDPPSTAHALAGATVIVNGSASNEIAGKTAYRREMVRYRSARLNCAYLYSNAGEGESTTDLVFSGHDLISEGGSLLAEVLPFASGTAITDIDLGRLAAGRRRISTFRPLEADYITVWFPLSPIQLDLIRPVAPDPFLPENKGDLDQRCQEILDIQSHGLKQRLRHTGLTHAIVGVSGGLDSTLALLVTTRTFDQLGLDRKHILAVTMPCFGTTDRTYTNACRLAQGLGCTLRQIPIGPTVERHFADIGHDPLQTDATYENAQARERTQVLMDLANQVGGLVIGTGDLSELALGWATYNGDHMSMYGVNSSVPKTLVRHLVGYAADSCGNPDLAAVLQDVLDTPVSPELLPADQGQIRQKTEDTVGPYRLHDFFLYYMLGCGYDPRKIFRLAQLAFAGQFSDAEILRWLRVFYSRFFSQQYKRSCMPDGPKVGSVGLSPRGDLRMPSDAQAALWLAALDRLEAEQRPASEGN